MSGGRRPGIQTYTRIDVGGVHGQDGLGYLLLPTRLFDKVFYRLGVYPWNTHSVQPRPTTSVWAMAVTFFEIGIKAVLQKVATSRFRARKGERVGRAATPHRQLIERTMAGTG